MRGPRGQCGAVGKVTNLPLVLFRHALIHLSYNGMERAARIELASVGLEGQLVAMTSPHVLPP